MDMLPLSRRTFMLQSAVLAAGIVTNTSFTTKKKAPLLSFSTLGCPDWSFGQIVNFASEHHYTGIELRGIRRQLDLTKCNEFNTAENRAASLKIIRDKGLHFVELGSSTTLHFAEGAERQKNLDEGRRFIDLAREIECPFIRVFPNNFTKDQDAELTFNLISSGLLELAQHAKGTGVSVLLETHGEFVKIADIKKLMEMAAHPQVGLVWDIANMWTVTKEPPAQVYEKLKKYIRHTHIKDAKWKAEKYQYTFLGKGDVPIFEAIDVLSKAGYKGYYSFEWEKLWHPEIEEPELAFANYSEVMNKHFH
jgi:sugar phosphate isomerase/epimerase